MSRIDLLKGFVERSGTATIYDPLDELPGETIEKMADLMQGITEVLVEYKHYKKSKREGTDALEYLLVFLALRYARHIKGRSVHYDK